MSRTIWVVAHPGPATPADIADATSVGASEVVCGLSEARPTPGLYVVEDARPVVAETEAPVTTRALPKSMVTDRLEAEGKLHAFMEILDADRPAFARWFASDRQMVYTDDPWLISTLTKIGAAIGRVTAPPDQETDSGKSYATPLHRIGRSGSEPNGPTPAAKRPGTD